MNRHAIVLTLLLSITPLFGMETDPDNNVAQYYYEPASLEEYPEGFGHIQEKDILASCDLIPPEQEQAITKFLDQDPEIQTLCSLSTQIRRTVAREPRNIRAANLSKANYIYDVKGANAVIKIAGFQNALFTTISSLGYDPYHNNSSFIVETARDARMPRFQHLSTLVTMKLIERAHSSTIVPVKTWAYHIPGQSYEFQDENYITVQEKMDQKYKQFSMLPPHEKHEVLNDHLDLAELYRVLKYANLWDPSEDNLWVNSNNLSKLPIQTEKNPIMRVREEKQNGRLLFLDKILVRPNIISEMNGTVDIVILKKY